MKIAYGIIENTIDVTDICFTTLRNRNIITIPSGDINRAHFFTDNNSGILKKVFILNNGILTEYDDSLTIKINTLTNTVEAINMNELVNKILNIHSTLQINHGSLNDEFPEQTMAVRYLKGNEKILEIGGNIGRNSLVISSILKANNNNNFVVLESDVNIAQQLLENRNINNFSFNIESSALSKRKLIQQGWNTIASDVLLDGYAEINIISFNELQKKYNIVFDTLVLDCEGAFYYILMDMPEMLNNINLIIMENDYNDISQKEQVDLILTVNNFYLDYVEEGGWGPCRSNFFEVWKR